MPNIFILNDTSLSNHHGCRAVMASMRTGLEQAGARVIGTSFVGNPWETDRRALAGIGEADAILINGEGTIHHGAPEAERLLRIAEHPLAAGKPLALVNTLYQQNPPEWRRYMKRFSIIATRDSFSTTELTGLGVEARTLLDLSLSFPAPAEPPSRGTLIGYGCSVYKDVRSRLKAAAAKRGADALYLPINTTQPRGVRLAPPLDRLANLEAGLRYRRDRWRFPQLRRFPTTEAFERALGGLGLYVTGRFHGVCLAIATGTPFIAVASNSHKIEALLTDIGLDRSRLMTIETIEAGIRPFPFADWEFAALTAALERARRESRDLFRDIAALAPAR
jgi:hypothetical protein